MLIEGLSYGFCQMVRKCHGHCHESDKYVSFSLFWRGGRFRSFGFLLDGDPIRLGRGGVRDDSIIAFIACIYYKPC